MFIKIVNLRLCYVILQNNFIKLHNLINDIPNLCFSSASHSSTQSEELSAMNAAAQLSDADLTLVMTEVYAARAKWPVIGMVLKIPYDNIECIEGENVDAGKGLRKMLVVWLRTGSKKTWRVLAEALGHSLVMEVNLMNSIIARLSPNGTLMHMATKAIHIGKFEVVYLVDLIIQ